MVRVLVTLVVYLISLVGIAQTDSTTELKIRNVKKYQINVEINKIVSNKGKVYFALYDSENNFNNRTPLKIQESEIENGIVNIIFDNLKPGTYAITCYHDANDNKKLDFVDDRPVEDYGATNNVMNFGPPQFENAKFDLISKDLTFEIKF